MTHKYTLRSGEQWESEFFPLSPASGYWIAKMVPDAAAVLCAGCYLSKTGEVYRNGNGHYWCPKCFKQLKVADWGPDKWPSMHLPVSLAHPRLTEEMADHGWTVLEGGERESMLDWLREHETYLIPPAQYPEVVPPRCSEDPILEDLVVHADTGDLYSHALGLTRPFQTKPFGYSHISYTCSVCGRGNQHEALYIRCGGVMHIACANWFLANELPAEYGMVEFKCGHWSLPWKDEVLKCADCAITASNAACRECLGSRDGRWRCDLHSRLHQQTMSRPELLMYGVDPGFDIFAALADFYILTDLHDRARELIQPEYVRRVKEIANAIARYTIMATGGEARHWLCTTRNDGFCTSMEPLDDSFDPGRDSYFCESTYLPDKCTAKPCQFASLHRKIIHYCGITGGNGACYKNGHVYLEVSDGAGCRIDGVWHPFQNNHALWEPLGLDVDRQLEKMPRDTGRALMWVKYLEAFQKHGVRVLEAAATMFSTGVWNQSYGGRKWARPAALVRDYAHGKFTPPTFIDMIFGVQHNGGSLFDKLWVLEIGGASFRTCLDVRRKMTSSLVLLPFASDGVRALWGETAGLTQDPELLLGARMWLETISIAKASWRERISKFAWLLRQYNHRSLYCNTRWSVAATRFRLLMKDKPKWRRRPRVSNGTTRKKKQEAVAVLATV
jgi:hypothetical protein